MFFYWLWLIFRSIIGFCSKSESQSGSEEREKGDLTFFFTEKVKFYESHVKLEITT